MNVTRIDVHLMSKGAVGHKLDALEPVFIATVDAKQNSMFRLTIMLNDYQCKLYVFILEWFSQIYNDTCTVNLSYWTCYNSRQMPHNLHCMKCSCAIFKDLQLKS